MLKYKKVPFFYFYTSFILLFRKFNWSILLFNFKGLKYRWSILKVYFPYSFFFKGCYNLTMMMETVFSFLPSYFSTIFLVKAKISKSVSLFLSHIVLKRCWSIRFQDFKSNISLEESSEIVYFFASWYQKLRVDRRTLGWVWSETIVATLVTRWMDEWMDEASWFFMLMQIQES